MNVSYDPAANIAYIRFRARTGAVETIRVADDFLVDVDETGAVCGIELLDANAQLTQGDDGKLVLENALSGGRTELDVA